jgi:organic hydroperoxide reductase OsmC/OhrA
MPTERIHRYLERVEWIGNDGVGTAGYRAYRRDFVVRSQSKPDLPGSSDPTFRGDAARYNPEELLVASLSSCHMLWYLHLCAVNNIVVESYVDEPEGTMEEGPGGEGHFTSVTLHPQVRIASGNRERAADLHAEAHAKCFIANSVNFPVTHEATIELVPPTPAPVPSVK